MTRHEALDLLRSAKGAPARRQTGEKGFVKSDDLIELGMRAHAKRQSLHPSRIVTYSWASSSSASSDGTAVRVVFDPQNPSLDPLEECKDAEAIVPVCVPGATAAEYLKFLAICRLYREEGHIQLDADWSGLKVAQVGLRFGGDDFGDRKPGNGASEEEIRRVIRDAGFVPKKRDLLYRAVAIN